MIIYGKIKEVYKKNDVVLGYSIYDLDKHNIINISANEIKDKVITENDNIEKDRNSWYYLLNKDNIIAKINIYFNKIEVNGKLLYGFESVNEWLGDRLRISCAREPKEFFRFIGINGKRALIEQTHCVSLHDNFWIKNIDSDLRWKDVSPYSKEYDNRVGVYALEDCLLKEDTGSCYNPTIGEEGSFPHKIEKTGNKIVFIKGSSKYTLGCANSGKEPFSEYFASKIGQYLKFDITDYKIKEHLRQDKKVDVITICNYFTTEKIGSVTANALGLDTYNKVIDYSKELGEKTLNKCLDMLFLDCLLINVDRHFNNIKFLIDNETLEVLDITPIFDNNCSLLPYYMEEYDKFKRTDYLARDGNTFESLYEEILKYKSYKKELENLKDFKIKQGVIKVKEERLKFLNWLLQEQVRYWLEFEEKIGRINK